MTAYEYTRDLVGGAYDIDNQYAPMPLCCEIRDSGLVPAEFTIASHETVCEITFSGELTVPQEADLDTLVATHKAYVEEI